MNIIDLIEIDAKKISTEKKWRKLIFIIFLIVSISIGYGTRQDYVEAFSWFNIIPSSILLFLTFFFFKHDRPKVYLPLAVLFFAISLLQTQTIISLSKFEESAKYWHEAFHCLSIGFFGGLVLTVFISLLFQYYFPLQSKKSVFKNSILISLAPTFLLSLHCPGPLRSHIIFSHWGASVLIFAICAVFLNLINQKRKRVINK